MATPKKFVNPEKVSRGPRNFFLPSGHLVNGRGSQSRACFKGLQPSPLLFPSGVFGLRLPMASRSAPMAVFHHDRAKAPLGRVDGPPGGVRAPRTTLRPSYAISVATS